MRPDPDQTPGDPCIVDRPHERAAIMSADRVLPQPAEDVLGMAHIVAGMLQRPVQMDQVDVGHSLLEVRKQGQVAEQLLTH
ncbi:MAG: hypothetical protein GF334_08820, partial [Candidatus Altiarchaeales archaeon]|nr:hypothetical protein [Candidatus Altiarchaeales archaeon]